MRDLGHELASHLGYTVGRSRDGDEGTVYTLNNGLVLKITDSTQEAALCLRIMQMQCDGDAHPGVPYIKMVVPLSETQDGESTYYAIIREDFHDVDFSYHEVFGRQEGRDTWEESLIFFRAAWLSGDENELEASLNVQKPYDLFLSDLLDGLRWIEDAFGFRMSDIKPDNIGVGSSGCLGMRDLGRGRVSKKLLEDLARLEPLEFQAFAPVSAF